MLFNSFAYFIFFILVVPGYYILRSQTLRVWWLLIASCVFYMYFVPKFILVLFTVIFVDYLSALAISKQKSVAHKRFFLGLSIASNLTILFFFKYYNFFIENTELLTGYSFSRLNILLPIGLSFHTFQSLSYTIEVYRGNQPAEKRLDILALYVMFFPQLVAGPIERPQNILHQLKEKKNFQYNSFLKGVWLISLGLIKKCVIADRLSIYVDDIYSTLPQSTSFSVWLAVIFFSLQIYFDFSGYSDIALGSAKCMGINLMLNFNAPYISKSLKEFWTRWHISLSSWFKDYVFIPLGGSRVSTLKHFRNIMIVFTLSGLWHGAKWNFVLWGILHGMFVFASAYTKKNSPKVNDGLKLPKVLLNFLIVTLLWVFFRAPDLSTAELVFDRLLQVPFALSELSFTRIDFGVFSLAITCFALLYLGSLTIYDNQQGIFPEKRTSTFLLTFNFILIFIFGVFNSQSFIYFQF